MAETKAATTTPRARRSRATKPATPASATTAKKPATRKPAPKKTQPPAEVAVEFELAYLGETRRYATFNQERDVNDNQTGCVGKFYAPLGTTSVKVILTGPAEVMEELVDEVEPVDLDAE